MKKLIYCALALAAGLFATSCQQENLEPVQEGNTVTYTVNMPEVATKANDNGELVDQLVYAVYRIKDSNTKVSDAKADINNANVCQLMYQKTMTIDSERIIVPLELIKNQRYIVLFWAQHKNAWFVAKAENEGDEEKTLGTFNIAYDDVYAPNNHNFDAFTGVDDIDVKGSASKSIVLTRPFGQLNIATNLPKKYTTEVENTTVTVTGIAKSYNVATQVGTVDENNPVVFTAAAPLKDSETNQYLQFGEYKRYLSMNYVFLAGENDDVTDAVTVTYDIATSHGNVANTITNVPVARNYKTNIIGNLITSQVDYTVEIKKAWDGEIIHANTTEAIQAALDNAAPGTTIQLEPGVKYGKLYLRPTVANVTAATCMCSNHTDIYTAEEFISHWANSQVAHGGHVPAYTANISNITIIGAEGATVEGIQAFSGNASAGVYDAVLGEANTGSYYVALNISNLKFENVAFTGKVNIEATKPAPLDAPIYDGITFDGCTFTTGGTAEANGPAIRYYSEENNGNIKNILVNECVFNNCRQGVYVHHVNGITITDNTFENTGHNAIGIQGHTGAAVNLKKVIITGNTFNNIGDRIIRFNEIGADSNITIQNNFATNSGDEDGEVIKATTIAEGVVTSVKNNYWGTGKTVANDELKDKGEFIVMNDQDLQAVLTEAAGNVIIKFGADINGDVTATQKAGVKITIDGSNKEYKGTITVKAQSNDDGVTPLVIKNVNFKTTETEEIFIHSVETNYYPHITVDSCSFEGTGPASDVVPVTIKSAKDFVMKNCTAKNVHSLIQNTSGWNITIQDCEVTNAGRGMSLGTVQGATIDNVKIGDETSPVTKYGIRINAEYEKTATIKDCEISAFIPVVVRKAIVNYNLVFDGTNTMTQTNTDGIWCAIGSSEYEENGTMPTPATGEVIVELIDKSLDKDGIYGATWPPVAKVGNNEYYSIDEAIAAWTNNTTLTLLSDVTLSNVVTLKSTEHHILDLSTYTMTAAEGKNAFVIKACGTGDSERTAITIKADGSNPGGINAGKKSVIYYKYADGGISGNDRPIIKIEGGVFTGSTSSIGTTGIHTIGSEARKCATLNISGGVFNCSIYGSSKSKLLISGGIFHYSVGSQGDSTALRLISGGTFKTLGFMTADSKNTKFWFGTSMGNSNVGLYVNDDNYLVVGGPVITKFDDRFEVKVKYSVWNSLLQYSSAADGLYYTEADNAVPADTPPDNKKWENILDYNPTYYPNK